MVAAVRRTPAAGPIAPRRFAERVATGVSPWALAIGGAVVLGLLALANAYGWHRDELYFVIAGRHPALGYPDQPPVTPILSALGVALLGPSPAAVRILPALAVGLAILLTVDLARRFGGAGRAQVVAATTLAATGFLFAGHLSSTATFDIVLWTVIAWLTGRLLAGGDQRLWLAVGLAGGLGFQNKHLVVILAAGLVVGFVLGRRFDVARSRYAWAGAAIAVLIALPNVLWQAAHGWPALQMARSISAGQDDAAFALELWLLSGSLIAIVPVVGLLRLLIHAEVAPWRPIGWAALASLGLVLATGGKAYYAIGILPVLVAAGAVAAERWLDRGRTLLRPIALGLTAAASITLTAVLTLPIVPASTLPSTPIVEVNGEQGEQIGWPELVATVRQAVESLPAADRAAAVILTSNYGEAGAIEVLGPDLPPVYSGHNGYWDWGPPPDGRSAAILVGPSSFQASGVGGCTVAGTIRNDAGVRNQEWGYQVRVCGTVPVSFADHWPRYRHLD